MNNTNGTNLHLTKKFPADKEVLYKAWTEPDQLKQWWKPMNKKLVHVQNDIRQGGEVVYEVEGNMKITGEYKDVAEGNKLVYSWNWELPEDSLHKGEYLLTVQFRENGDGSALEVSQDQFKNEHAIKPHRDGWEEALEELKKFLGK